MKLCENNQNTRIKMLVLLMLFCLQISDLTAQDTLVQKKLQLNGDLRFRVEHDWNSQRADGSFRDDRSRLRLRTRLGFKYQYNNWASFGARIRTGNLNDQQGPHITLGNGNGEFANLQLGLERAYLKIQHQNLQIWLGKNKFSFKKQNELFWNDNVNPEGAFLQLKIPSNSKWINSIVVNTGHFIVQSSGKTFDKDSYFQAFQIMTKHWNKRLKFFPSFYYFNRLSNIPDGQGSSSMPYAILHLGANIKIINQPRLLLGVDYYNNLQGDFVMQNNEDIWVNQNEGTVLTMKLGQIKKKGDWTLQLYYAYLEKFAVVDYFAQNDWARWDYSSQGASGSRLTNFEGLEVRVGYGLGENFKLILRGYQVKQLVAEGAVRETGTRVRLDLDIAF